MTKKRLSQAPPCSAELEKGVAALPSHVRNLASRLTSSTDSMKLNKERMSQTGQAAAESTEEEIQMLPPHVRGLASKLTSATDSMKLNKARMSEK